MMHQLLTRKRTSTWALNSRAFGEGFKEAKKGKPLDYAKYTGNIDDQWNYERGRLFAQVYDGEIKKDRRVTFKAQWAFTLAIRDGIIL